MQIEAIQLGVYAFVGASIALSCGAAVSTLVRSHSGLELTFTVWGWLWKLAGVYAGLALLAVGIPNSIDRLSATTETILSMACLIATIPLWWLLHRWHKGRRARREAARATVQEAANTVEHAARVRRTGRIRIG